MRVQALLEAVAPVRGADSSDGLFRRGCIVQVCVPSGLHRSSMRPEGAASFKYACARLQLLGQVRAASHAIEHASVPVGPRVVTLAADAHGIIADFASVALAS